MGETDHIQSRFATTEEEADRRYSEFSARDPFPEIAPALLNSADIEDYVAATGMIVPFHNKEIKPASYGVELGGKCIYWDENNSKHRFIISQRPDPEGIEHRDEVKLPRNSITSVSLLPTFRLPQYIALRFNLKIKNVYRGLLLGTGPLVDPGFQGKLSFPLHNLTKDEYTLRADEAVIYAEFTKLSHWTAWTGEQSQSSRPRRQGVYSPFASEKLQRRDLDDYLFHATAGTPVVSSIPQEVREMGALVARADQRAAAASSVAENIREETRRRASRTLIWTVIGIALSLVLGLGSAWYTIAQILGNANQIAQVATGDATDARVDVAHLSERIGNELRENAAALATMKVNSDEDRIRVKQVEQGLREMSSTLGEISTRATSEFNELKKEVDDIRGRLDQLGRSAPIKHTR